MWCCLVDWIGVFCNFAKRNRKAMAKKKMKTLIVFICILCIPMNVSAQNENMLNAMISQCLECFFHRFDTSESEWCRNYYTNHLKYVSKDGLPLDFCNNYSNEYVFHDTDYESIKKIEESKHAGISTVLVYLNVYKNIILIRINDVGIGYKSKKEKIIVCSETREYKFQYNQEQEKWIMLQD